jgi:UDP-N-acetylmuramoyl-L-alanyl-D-glutamate--2,6-diaminopimelate ligase
VRVIAGTPSQITGVSHDSRTVSEGAAFVAIPGFAKDGNRYIPDAAARGARALVLQEDAEAAWASAVTGLDLPIVVVPDARIALAQAAAGFNGHPSRELGMIGVTGTDGKTTTTHLIAHVLNACGMPAGYSSSVEFSDSHTVELNASHMTTVEANEIQRQLAAVLAAGGRYAVIEASSIGLDLHRVDECDFDVGVFTNLTPDHLDYHGDMERYRDAKAILFRMLGESTDKGLTKAAIINADDAASPYFSAVAKAPITSYGIQRDADIIARDIASDGFATAFTVKMGDRSARARVKLLGGYNAANCIAAVAVAVSQGVGLDKAVAVLHSFPGVPGRMELIEEGQPFRVVIDIASTEQAMRNVLGMLRPITTGKLIVVFGAAGERDTARRTTIARAVAELADYAVITNEDPRSEDPESIINEIARALGATFEFVREPDRREALKLAFERATVGDTVLLAGKGTEQSIVIGTKHIPWDERRVARELLNGKS